MVSAYAQRYRDDPAFRARRLAISQRYNHRRRLVTAYYNNAPAEIIARTILDELEAEEALATSE